VPGCACVASGATCPCTVCCGRQGTAMGWWKGRGMRHGAAHTPAHTHCMILSCSRSSGGHRSWTLTLHCIMHNAPPSWHLLPPGNHPRVCCRSALPQAPSAHHPSLQATSCSTSGPQRARSPPAAAALVKRQQRQEKGTGRQPRPHSKKRGCAIST